MKFAVSRAGRELVFQHWGGTTLTDGDVSVEPAVSEAYRLRSANEAVRYLRRSRQVLDCLGRRKPIGRASHCWIISRDDLFGPDVIKICMSVSESLGPKATTFLLTVTVAKMIHRLGNQCGVPDHMTKVSAEVNRMFACNQLMGEQDR